MGLTTVTMEFYSSRWMPVCSVFIRMFFFGGVLKANVVILSYTVTRLDATNVSVASAFTLQSSIAYLLTPLGGRLMLRFLTFRHLGVIGGLLAGLGVVGAGLFVRSTWHLYIWHSLTGIGFAVSTIPNVLYICINYEEYFSRIMAMSIAFIYVGVALLPITLKWLIDHLGYEGGITCFGALVWNCVIVGILMFPTKKTKTFTEQISGSVSRDDLHFYDKYFFFLSTPLRHSKFAVMTTFSFILMYVYSSWAIFLVPFGQEQGLKSHEAVLLSTVGGFGGTVGSFASMVAFHLDKMNAITCCFLPMLINGVVLLLSVYVSQVEMLTYLMFVSGSVQGFQYGGVIGILAHLVCEYHMESAYIYSCFTEGVSCQLGGLLSGMILDYTGETWYIFLACSAVSLLITPLSFLWICDKSPVRECYPERK